LGIEAAGAHECLGGFSVLGARREAKGKKIMKEELKAEELRNADCGKKKNRRQRLSAGSINEKRDGAET
jgi:hypothetical protein